MISDVNYRKRIQPHWALNIQRHLALITCDQCCPVDIESLIPPVLPEQKLPKRIAALANQRWQTAKKQL
jgi:hypothetical protein